MVCVTDLGFSRSVAFGSLAALKAPTHSVVGLGSSVRPLVRASVLAGPALDIVRVCVFYALVQTGVAVPSSILRGTIPRPEYEKQCLFVCISLMLRMW